MSTVLYLFRRGLLRRWRSWLGVTLLLGAFGGVATGGAAGARRTETAYAGFTASHQAADLFVDEFLPNPDVASVTHAQVAATSGVADAQQVRSFSFEGLAFNGLAFNGGDPKATAVVLTAEGFTSLQLVATPDGRAYGTGLDRLKLISGRLANPPGRTQDAGLRSSPGPAHGGLAGHHPGADLGGDRHPAGGWPRAGLAGTPWLPASAPSASRPCRCWICPGSRTEVAPVEVRSGPGPGGQGAL